MGGYEGPGVFVPPPQRVDPMEQYGKLLQMKSMAGEQQEQQQRIQANQMDLDSQQAFQQAYQDAEGDPEKTQKLAAKYGAKPTALLEWQRMVIGQKIQVADLVTKNAGEAKRQADLMQGAHDQIAGLPEEQRAAAWPQIAQGLHQQGVDVSQLPPQYPGAQSFQTMGFGVKAHTQMVEEEVKKQEAFKNKSQGEEAQAGTKVKNLELSFGGSPQLQESRYRFTLQRIKEGKPISDEDMAAATAYEAANRKTTTSSDSLGVVSTNTSGPSGLAAVRKPQGGGRAGAAKPSTEDSIVDLLGQYKADPQTLSRMFIKHPEILGMVQQKYPDFDQTSYAAKNKLMQGMTSGSQSKEINAINTAMGHMAVLDDAATALENGDVNLLNTIANKAGAAIGHTPATTYRTIVHRVGPEITSAYIPGAGGEHERIANADDFSENAAPGQLHSNIGISVKLLRSKVGALENQYKNTVGRDDFQQRFITPEAQSAFNRLSPKEGSAGGAGKTSGPPPGATHKAPGSDGKMHYTNVQGQDLGVVQQN